VNNCSVYCTFQVLPRLLPESIRWGAPTGTGGTRFERQWSGWYLWQLQPAADIGARKKPVRKHGSEVTYRSVVTSAASGDPVQEFARFVTSGRRFQQKGASDGQEKHEKEQRARPDAAGIAC
jgi:hypothetical protein